MEFCGLLLCLPREFQADPTVADETARLIEHRLPADLKPAGLAIAGSPAEYEVKKWLARCYLCPQLRSLRFIPPGRFVVGLLIAKGIHPNAEHLQHWPGNPDECARLVLLPIPIRRELRQTSEACFAFAQLGGTLLQGALEQSVVVVQLPVQQPHLKSVADTRLDLHQVERFAD